MIDARRRRRRRGSPVQGTLPRVGEGRRGDRPECFVDRGVEVLGQPGDRDPLLGEAHRGPPFGLGVGEDDRSRRRRLRLVRQDPAAVHLRRPLESDRGFEVAAGLGIDALRLESPVVDALRAAVGLQGVVRGGRPRLAPGAQLVAVVPLPLLVTEALRADRAHRQQDVTVRIWPALAVEGEVGDHALVHVLALYVVADQFAARVPRKLPRDRDPNFSS